MIGLANAHLQAQLALWSQCCSLKCVGTPTECNTYYIANIRRITSICFNLFMSQTMAKEMTRMSVTGKNFISRHPLDIQNFFFLIFLCLRQRPRRWPERLSPRRALYLDIRWTSRTSGRRELSREPMESENNVQCKFIYIWKRFKMATTALFSASAL